MGTARRTRDPVDWQPDQLVRTGVRSAVRVRALPSGQDKAITLRVCVVAEGDQYLCREADRD